MSLHEYKVSQEIATKDYPFYALLMELMRKADDINTKKIKLAWPDKWKEMEARYNSPGGLLPGETE
jgi:hypothetical protein